MQALGIDLQPGASIARSKAADGGASDIGGDRHVVRPLDIGAGEQGLAKVERGVDIEFGGIEFGIKLGRPGARGENINETAGQA